VSDGDDVWYGDDGRFYVDLANQMAVCTAAWSSVTGPSVSAEIADVEEYFIGAGMPVSQIGSIGSTYSAASNGASFSNAVVSRVVEGVPVPDSNAAAGLVDGQSLDEIVYWPALPASVSEELAKLKAIEADPQKLAAFQAKLPSGFVTGSIVIHHTNEGGQEVLAGSAREEGGKRPLESYRNPSYEQKSRRADPFGAWRKESC
jgi:hypothetical protein